MGMGHGANWCEVISDEDLDKLLGHGLQEIKNYLKDHDEDLDSLACNIYYDTGDIEEEVYEKALVLLTAIENKFKEKTGLGVSIDYHDQAEMGDRYDDVDGHFWVVNGFYVISEEGKKIQEMVQTVGWVTYG